MELQKDLITHLCNAIEIQPNKNIDEEEDPKDQTHKMFHFINGTDLQMTANELSFQNSENICFQKNNPTQIHSSAGRIYWKKIATYEGQIADVLRHGWGTYLDTKLGVNYEGKWYLGLKHGFGKLRYSNGSFYEGFFSFGVRHGKGLYQYESGNVYMGEWSFDQKEGFGKIYWASANQRYKGYWKNNTQMGVGECVWKHESAKNERKFKTRFVGLWKNGMQEGYGVTYFSNGDILLGNWVGNKKEGYFLLINNHGHEKELLFLEDKVCQNKKTEKKSWISGKAVTSSIRLKSPKSISGAKDFEKTGERKNLRATFLTTINPGQSLEEMNEYRQIVKIHELFANIQISEAEKEIVFENTILLLIRYNGILKGIFDYFKATNKISNPIKGEGKVYLADFVSLIDNITWKSPYLSSEVLVRFYLQNWKNKGLMDFNFEKMFRMINEMRRSKNSWSVSSFDDQIQSYFNFEINLRQKQNGSLHEEIVQEIKSQIKEEKQQRRNLLRGIYPQLKYFSKAKSKATLMDTQMGYFNFIDALLRLVLVSTNYSPRNFEEVLQRLLSEELGLIGGKLSWKNKETSEGRLDGKKSKENDLRLIQQMFRDKETLLTHEARLKTRQSMEARIKQVEDTAYLRILNTFTAFYRHCENSSRFVFNGGVKGILLKRAFVILFEFAKSDNPSIVVILTDLIFMKTEITREMQVGSSAEELVSQENEIVESVELEIENYEKKQRMLAVLNSNRNSLLQSFNSFSGWPQFLKLVLRFPNLEIFVNLLEISLGKRAKLGRKRPPRIWKKFVSADNEGEI